MTLSMQVLVHRMVSLKLVNNYAFLAISLTMLGFALSGVVLARGLERFLARREDTITACAALFAITTIGASIVFYHAGTSVHLTRSRPEFFSAMAQTMPLALLYAVPFAFTGIILGVLLSSPDLPVRRIYAWDLVGSAAGALAVLPAIRHVGVEASLLIVAALGVLVPLALSPPRGRVARGLAVASLLVIVGAFIAQDQAFRMRYPDGSMLAATRNPSSGMTIVHGAWDPLAHIEVVRGPAPDARRSNFPALLGNNPAWWARIEMMLTQNNWAFTIAPRYGGTPESLAGVEQTIYAAPYHARPMARPRVYIIGVGGGSDVLAALAADASAIVAAEVNAATVEILSSTFRDYFRWVDDPRVRLVNAEGRSQLLATPGAFDVITVSGVDTYSGTPAAAHVFSENYLYTNEAFDLFLRKLTPNGILSVQRLEFVPPREMLRALTTAVAALRRAGARTPADHILMVTMMNGRFTAMLVGRQPFSADDARRLATWAASTEYLGLSAGSPINAQRVNAYQVFLGLDSPEREEAFATFYPFDITPVGDDRPFFLHYAYWWHLLSSDPLVQRSVPAMQYSVLVLLVIIGLAAVACVWLPLRDHRKRGAAAPGTWRYATFFAAIGVGYLMIELALIQKFGLFLGHPNYALSVVLAALLLATGVGALASGWVLAAPARLRLVGGGLCVMVLALQFLVAPWLPEIGPLPVAARAVIVAALVMPIGLCLGVFLPYGLERLKATHPALAPWAWGINGVFSVLAPIAGVAVSMTWGIGVLLLAGLPIYLVAVLVLEPS